MGYYEQTRSFQSNAIGTPSIAYFAGGDYVTNNFVEEHNHSMIQESC